MPQLTTTFFLFSNKNVSGQLVENLYHLSLRWLSVDKGKDFNNY